MTTIWKCSEKSTDITPHLTGQVSPNCNILQLCRWVNGRVGAIVPISGTLTMYFTEVLPDSSRNSPRMDFEPEYGKEWDNPDLESHIVSYGGIVARWLIESRGLHPNGNGFELFNDSNFRKNILNTLKEEPYFDTLYETHLEAAREEARRIFDSMRDKRRKKPGAWKPENKEFKFSLEQHLKEERNMTRINESYLYPFFRKEDVEFMRAITKDYHDYIQYLIKKTSTDTPPSPSEEKEKHKEEKPFEPTQDTFEIANTTPERLKEVFLLCIENKWLDDSTRVDDWLKLFSGVPSPVRMVWDVEKSDALRDLFYMMDKKKDAEGKTFLKPRKNYLQIVSSHFVSNKPTRNNPRPYITDFGGRNNKKEYEQKIEYCRRILKGEDTNKIIYEMLQEQNKSKKQKEGSYIEEAMPEHLQINRDNAALQDSLYNSRNKYTSNYHDE